MAESKVYPIEEALRAQSALRATAGLGPELFPLDAFVGMISDEIEALRKLGKTDDEIAAIIRESSAIDVSADEIKAHYATPEERHQHPE